MRTEKRFSLNRTDAFRLGKMIEAAIEDVAGGKAYKLGMSDATVAAEASAALDKAMDGANIAKLRKVMIGKLVTDGRTAKDQATAVAAEVAALRKQVIDQGRMIATLRTEMDEFLQYDAGTPAPAPPPKQCHVERNTHQRARLT